jgi:hypothetical protein
MKLFSFFRKREGAPPATTARVDRIVEPSGIRLITTELHDSGIRELEVVDVPDDLEPLATDLLLRFASAAIAEKPQRDGATIGGALLGETQGAVHVATLRLVTRSIEPGSPELFRLVDFDEPHGSRFPARLMATHLALVAETLSNRREAERLYRRSIELYPGEVAKSDGKFEFDRAENFNNYLAWEGLGETLLANGQVAEGESALSEAALRCPAWASDFSAHIAAQVEARPELARDAAIQFWLKRL